MVSPCPEYLSVHTHTFQTRTRGPPNFPHLAEISPEEGSEDPRGSPVPFGHTSLQHAQVLGMVPTRGTSQVLVVTTEKDLQAQNQQQLPTEHLQSLPRNSTSTKVIAGGKERRKISGWRHRDLFSHKHQTCISISTEPQPSQWG